MEMTSNVTTATKTLARYFWATLVITFALKLLLSVMIPVTGDEAYYAIWGKFPALGYYDHTPFIGWLLYPFVHFGHSDILLRLPTVLATTIIGLVIYRFLQSVDINKEKAALAAILFLISPLSLCAVLITTDTPVILFTFLSGICVLKAIQKNDAYLWYASGGLFLGLAFFSKYFAVLMALAYGIYFLWGAPNRRRIIGFLILLAFVLPFGLENLYWNYTHAWANILFNLYNRNTTDYFGFTNLFTYFLTLFYIITPPLFYYLFFKHPKYLFSKQALNLFIVVPLLFFLCLSTYKEIGLHWPLSFVTFIYVWAGFWLSFTELKKAVIFMLWFTGFHLLCIVILYLMPLSVWQKLPLSDKTYTKIVYFFKHQTISDYLMPYSKNYTFTSLNYVQADMLFYDTGKYAPTFGVGSVHGRQDDLMTDFKTLAHKNLLIFYTRPPKLEEYAPYFAKTDIRQFILDGVIFYYVLGDDFNYPAYRDTVLRYINTTYWQVPDYIPHEKSFFCERYFKGEKRC